jgi:hypothetical protein
MAQKKSAKPRKATLDKILSTMESGFTRLEGRMERGFAAVAEDIGDIKSTMATKDDLAAAKAELKSDFATLGVQVASIEREKKQSAATSTMSAVKSITSSAEWR